MSFDLEKAIATWRQFHERRRMLLPQDLNELECHLRDHVAERVGVGVSEEAAFEEALLAVGDMGEAEPEYQKVYWGKLKRNHQRLDEIRGGISMLKNYLTVAWRNLLRYPGYTLINGLGLAVGMACFLLMALFVHDEWRYDRHHDNADRIVRITQHYTDEDGTRSFARSVPALGPTLQQEIAEIEETVRFQRFTAPLRNGDRLFNEDGLFFAEPSVFEVFTLPLVQGDAATALVAPNTLVLTETAAVRYFGGADPLGQTLTMSDTLQFTVTGVVENPPRQSHLSFEVLLSFETLRHRFAAQWGDIDTHWRSGTFYTYALLADPAMRTAAEAQLPALIEQHLGEDTSLQVQLQPLTDIHLRSSLRQELGPNGSASAVYIFAGIALLILLISCINFINLTTARATRRAREIGVRKALGAQRGQLTRQFLGEAVLLSVLAGGMAVMLVLVLLPWFNALTDKTLMWSSVLQGPYLLSVFGVALGAGMLAGAYPALLLASYRAAQVLKGTQRAEPRSRTVLLRRGLVAFQFALSVGIMAATVIAIQQVDHLKSRPLGFADEQVVVVPFYWEPVVVERLETLKTELQAVPSIRHVTASGDVPGRMFTSMSYWIEGMPTDESRGINALIVDPDFAETYGLTMVAGQDFAPELAADLGETFILNEAAVAEMGLTPEEVIGKPFRMNSQGPVVGVVEDFHFEGLQHKLEPLVMTVWPSWFGYLSVQVDAAQLPTTLLALEQTWKTVVPEIPYDFFFLDEDFNTQYRAEERFEQVFLSFALLALFISALGLFGLAAYTAERRTKEIGVRKVLGASASGIVWMLTKDVAQLVVVGFLVAVPVVYLGMERWLAAFAYRVDAGGLPFLLAGGFTLGLAVLAVGLQSLKAALADPVRSLRYE